MGAGASALPDGTNVEEQARAKVAALYKTLDPEDKQQVPRADAWAAIHSDEELATLIGNMDLEQGKKILKSMQAARALDTNFDGVITAEEFNNLVDPAVYTAAVAAVEAGLSTAETLPNAAQLAEQGFAPELTTKWQAAWKAAAGKRDWTTWDAGAWVEAGSEGGFDGAKVKPTEVFFLFVTMSAEDGAGLEKLATTWGLSDTEAKGFVNCLFRTVYMVTQEMSASEDPDCVEVVKAIEATVKSPFADYKAPLQAAAFAERDAAAAAPAEAEAVATPTEATTAAE